MAEYLNIGSGNIRNPFIENTDFSTLNYIKLLGGEPLMEQDVLIKKYKGTPAAKLARYSAGMAYLNLKEYKFSINFV